MPGLSQPLYMPERENRQADEKLSGTKEAKYQWSWQLRLWMTMLTKTEWQGVYIYGMNASW